MSSPSPDHAASTQVQLQREVAVDGSQYRIRATSAEAITDAVVLEVLGAGPGGEATEGHFTVSTTALGHLGPLLAQIFDGLAQLHGVTSPGGRKARPDRRSRRRDGGPTNSHQPWTPELKDQLRHRWEDADPAEDPEQLHAVIATEMQRSSLAIRSALERLDLDPEHPGQPPHIPESP